MYFLISLKQPPVESLLLSRRFTRSRGGAILRLAQERSNTRWKRILESKSARIQRIERMIENNVILSREDFDYAEKHLKDGCLDLQTKGRCLTMLGELYNHRARMYRDRAAEIAKQALEIEPDKHDNHAVLCEAMNGVFMDWCITNHTAIIEYYKYFIKKNPHDRAGYMWLIDNLIIDGRFSEAKEALESMRRIKDTYHYLMYKGWIARFESGWEQAQPYWDEMVEKYADDWHTWSSRGDAYAKRGQYKLAISDYRRATELECAPRFTDNFDSIAQISLLMEDKKGAIEAYEQVVRILREEWDMQEGETVLGYLQNIAQLKSEL